MLSSTLWASLISPSLPSTVQVWTLFPHLWEGTGIDSCYQGLAAKRTAEGWTPMLRFPQWLAKLLMWQLALPVSYCHPSAGCCMNVWSINALEP
jgi:hypothetical protein